MSFFNKSLRGRWQLAIRTLLVQYSRLYYIGKEITTNCCVNQLLKRLFKLNLSKPKYIETWDTNKFLHQVISIKRLENAWKVKHRHVTTGEEFEDYDYVIIGTGHHSKPIRPVIKGEQLFKGTIIHSHDYRVPDPYTNHKVLIIGSGPSGMEISLLVADVASRLIHSHHSPAPFTSPFPHHYVRKPDVKELKEHGVVFVDGSFEEIDDIIYCTGYAYEYPFLDNSSGLTLATRSVTPLHKYMVNINQPTMVFLGLVVRACLVTAIDVQARNATAMINGNFTLPSKEAMMREWQAHADAILAKGRPLSQIHLLADKEDQYYEELTRESGISRVPPVLFKIRNCDMGAKLQNLYTYRKYTYTVIDNETFTRRLEDEIPTPCRNVI